MKSVNPPDIEWVTQLSGQLSLIDQKFEAAEADDKIFGYVLVTGYLLNVLNGLPGFTAELTTLSDLAMKLDEVSRGNNALAPVKRDKGGRAPQGWRSAIMQGRSAAAVDVLVHRGFTEEDAAKTVAAALSKDKVIGRQGRPISSSTVKSWRATVVWGSANEKAEARVIYAEALRLLDYWLPPDASPAVLKSAITKFCRLSQSSRSRLLINPPLSRE